MPATYLDALIAQLEETIEQDGASSIRAHQLTDAIILAASL